MNVNPLVFSLVCLIDSYECESLGVLLALCCLWISHFYSDIFIFTLVFSIAGLYGHVMLSLLLQFDLRTRNATELFTCQTIDDRRRRFTSVIPLNAITIDPRNPNLFAVAGSDEYTRLYDIRKYKWDGSTDFGQPTNYFCPPHLIGDDHVGITGLAFSEQSELLVSYNDECIYLFTHDMGLGPNPLPASPVSMGSDASEIGGDLQLAASPSAMDTDEKVTPQAYKGHRNCETVKGVNFFGPQCEYVVSGSDCGRIFIWKKKGGDLIRVMEADKDIVNCIECHPHTMALASSGIDTDIKLWTPKAFERAVLPTNIDQVCFVILSYLFKAKNFICSY